MISRYKVSRAPTDTLDALRATMQAAVLSGEPITFVGFWGVGGRMDVAEPDHLAIKRLVELREEMRDALGRHEVRIALLLADVHARCNRIPEPRITRYLEGIREFAGSKGIDTRWLSEFWRSAGLSDLEVEQLVSNPATKKSWQEFSLRDQFLQQAAKRAGSADLAEEFAYNYYCTCLTEREMLTNALRGSIFFTYNDPRYKVILPAIPTVYWHSTKPGTSVKPWFM
jgi:hypothetical protein